jgi:hypothetical protein
MEKNLLNKFNDWHRDNPQVYELFKQFAFEAIIRGHKRLSAWLVVGRIRWETSIITHGDDYKVSNDFIALYARKFMADYPQHECFFATKEMKRA